MNFSKLSFKPYLVPSAFEPPFRAAHKLNDLYRLFAVKFGVVEITPPICGRLAARVS